MPRFQAALPRRGRDGILTPDATALDEAPVRRFQGGVDVPGSGFGLVHGRRSA